VRPKTIVLGAVERQGKVRATIIPSSRAWHLLPTVRRFVLPGSMVFTDEWYGYNKLGESRYTHRRIAHKQAVYVAGDTHTQTIEGFFGLFKTGVRGAHHSVSAKWLQGYLNEWTWRYNRRDDGHVMFRELVETAAKK